MFTVEILLQVCYFLIQQAKVVISIYRVNNSEVEITQINQKNEKSQYENLGTVSADEGNYSTKSLFQMLKDWIDYFVLLSAELYNIERLF